MRTGRPAPAPGSRSSSFCSACWDHAVHSGGEPSWPHPDGCRWYTACAPVLPWALPASLSSHHQAPVPVALMAPLPAKAFRAPALKQGPRPAYGQLAAHTTSPCRTHLPNYWNLGCLTSVSGTRYARGAQGKHWRDVKGIHLLSTVCKAQNQGPDSRHFI